MRDISCQLLVIGVSLNVLLMVFNFLPIPPLDGSHALEVLLPYEAQRGYEQLKPYGFFLLLAFAENDIGRKTEDGNLLRDWCGDRSLGL